MNLQLLENRSTLQPKKGHQRDAYQGPLHYQTKKRHGKGNYLYPNKFFEYQGEYVQGKKHGLGILKLNDGTQIQADFNDDQIDGKGKITYPDGSFYEGSLSYGQRNGHGVFQSQFQQYQGEWSENSKEGEGYHEIISRGQVYEGTFKKNKLEGQGSLKSYNYQYKGEWKQGKKQGHGSELSLWRRVNDLSTQQQPKYDKVKNYDSYFYEGSFANDAFHGNGKYSSKTTSYIYEGEFAQGLPITYPNQLRAYVSSNFKTQTAEDKETDKTLLEESSPFDYQLETEYINLYIELVYQGPEYLDQNQPSQQEIENLIKNWQNQNKKNKNPPPMPDFRTPKMKKPELILITQQNARPLVITLEKQSEGTYQKMKIDYRNQIAQKRTEFQKIKEEQRKVEDEDPKKKGSKKQAKNEGEFKINIFKQSPSQKQKSIKLQTTSGSCSLMNFELPDDFPQGKYLLTIESNFSDFGKVKPRKIEFIVKGKQAATKKK